MSTSGEQQNVAEGPSATGTTHFSVPPGPGTGPLAPPRPASDVAGSFSQRPPSAPSRSGTATPQTPPMRFTSHTDAEGRAFMQDQDGNRFDIVPQGNDDGRSQSSRSEGCPGVPAHHSALFGSSSDRGEPSTESVLSDSTPVEGTAESYPPLELDIDPDMLDAPNLHS
ncbi:hypothetical protein FB451DRAFT_1161987 [Mycena latifolia]|nr:hypothetical protein FB451DRAFT_1161987 [Mycena latifolia]